MYTVNDKRRRQSVICADVDFEHWFFSKVLVCSVWTTGSLWLRQRRLLLLWSLPLWWQCWSKVSHCARCTIVWRWSCRVYAWDQVLHLFIKFRLLIRRLELKIEYNVKFGVKGCSQSSLHPDLDTAVSMASGKLGRYILVLFFSFCKW